MRDSIPVRAVLVAASLLFSWVLAEVALRLLELEGWVEPRALPHPLAEKILR